MGKDKYTYTRLSLDDQTFYKELAERCSNDCVSVLLKGGLQNDLYKECWLKGFQYAGERIKRIFELLDRRMKNEKTKD